MLSIFQEPEKNNNRAVALFGFALALANIALSGQFILSISERLVPLLLIRFIIMLINPLFVMYFYFIVIKQSSQQKTIWALWLEKNIWIIWLLVGLIIITPIIIGVEYLGFMPTNFGTRLFLGNNLLPKLQSDSLSLANIGQGILFQINLFFQILIPIFVLILSITHTIKGLREKTKVDAYIYLIIFAASSFLYFALQIVPFDKSFPIEVLLILVNLLMTGGYASIGLNLGGDTIEENINLGYQKISLKHKFTLSFSILGITLILISGLIINRIIQNYEIDNFNELSSDKINRVHAEMKNIVNPIFYSLTVLSNNFPEAEEAIQNQLGELQEKYPTISTLAFVPLRGQTITATSLDETSIILSNEDWFWVIGTTQQPYTGFVTNEETLLNSSIEIVMPLFTSPNSRLVSGYLYAELLFREMPIFNTTDIINVFSVSEVPVYSTFSNITSELDDFSNSKAIISLASITPLNTISQNKFYYNIYETLYLFENTNAPLEGVVSYASPAMQITKYTNLLLLMLLSMLIGLFFIQLILRIVVQNHLIQPISEIINTFKIKFSTKKFNDIELSSKDELYELSQNINLDYSNESSKEKELQKLIDGLNFRLNRRATQLSAFTSIISSSTSSLDDINSMLSEYSNVISQQFDYYHVGIFLLDENKEYAVLQSANSIGGKRMLARGHRLEVGRIGCVGYAASTGRSRIAQDIDSDILYYANPDMSETQSEISIPMIENNSVIGVLDIQSKRKNAFLTDDIDILTSLGSQIVFSIRNYERTVVSEKNLQELNELYGEKIKDAWNKHTEKQSIQYVYKQTGSADTAELVLDDFILQDPLRIQKEIILHNKSIGKIQLRKDETKWSEDELILVEEILEQSAQALETARLSEQTRIRSSQIELLQTVTATCASTLDQTSILETVSDVILEELKLAHISMLLFDEEQEKINVIVDKSSTNKLSQLLGKQFDLTSSNQIMKVSTNHSLEILYHAKDYILDSVLSDIMNDYDDASTLILSPLLAHDIVFGAMIFVVDEEENKIIDEQEATLIEQISSQIASALEISTLFDSESKSRQATASLLEISRLASSSLAIGEVLTEIAQMTAVETNAYRCSIFQMDPDRTKLVPMLTRLSSGSSDLAYLRRIQDIFNEPFETIEPLDQFNNNSASLLIELTKAPQLIQQRWMMPYEITYLLMIPIVNQAQIVGAIVLDSLEQDMPFSQAQINLAEAISGILATTIENASLFEKAIDQAEREHLVTDITSKMRSSNDPKEILHTAISELRNIYKPTYYESPETPPQTRDLQDAEEGES